MRMSRGYSLVELAVALLVAGLLVPVVAVCLRWSAQHERRAASARAVAVARKAIAGFVFIHGRLPCPASVPAGNEDCSIGQGYLPARSLGMAAAARNAAGLPLYYAVYDGLQDSGDRFHPLIASGAPPVASFHSFGRGNTLDFCQAVADAAAANGDTARLHVGSGSSVDNAAYLLVDPGAGDADGDGDVLDGLNAGNDTSFDRPERQPTPTDDDTVFVAWPDEVWSEAGCTAVAPAGRAHPNVVTAAAVMKQAVYDYNTQLQLAVALAVADEVAAGATLASASTGLAIATTTFFTALSETLVSQGSLSALVALGAASIASNTAAVASATVALAAATANIAAATYILDNFLGKVRRIEDLYDQFLQHADAADAAGVYSR